MAADATKIYSGPATKIELSPDDTVWTDAGFMNANAEINWEPAAAELSDQNEVQLSGKGTIVFELVQSDDPTIEAIKTYRTAKAYVRVTGVDTKTYKVSGIFLKMEVKRGFKPGEPHTIRVMGGRATLHADDWCAAPV
ncbi:MAG: hypothetical protein ACE5IR_16185 [bacterium]